MGLPVNVVHELTGGIEDLQTKPLGAVVEGGRDAVSRKNDGGLVNRRHVLDGAYPEVLHLLDHAFVVNDLSQDGATAALAGETLHLEVGNPHTGTEPVLLRSDDSHWLILTSGPRSMFLLTRHPRT